MVHKEKIIHPSFAVLISSEDKIIFMWQVNIATPSSMLPNTRGNLFSTQILWKKHSPLVQAGTRTVPGAGHVPFFK